MAEQNKEDLKPLPKITSLTQPFWEAAAKKKLALQRCTACGSFIWCPRPVCGECGTDRLEWTPLSGRGTVYSFTVIREVVGRGLKAFEKEIPYVVAWIDLEEGPRFCSNVIGCPIEKVEIGMSVEVYFEEAGPGIFLPKFKPFSNQ